MILYVDILSVYCVGICLQFLQHTSSTFFLYLLHLVIRLQSSIRPPCSHPQPPLPSPPLPSHPSNSLPLHMQSRVPTDEDAPGEDESEANEQLREHYRRQYEAKTIRELRVLCIHKSIKIRGSKAELVERLVANEMEELEKRWV